MTEQEQRQRFVDAALAYCGTKYHHAGQIKGGGVDCATLLYCAAKDAGIVGEITLPSYPPAWHMHRGSERYVATLEKWCKEVPMPPLPGDIALWRFGRSFSHAAIVVEWPKIVHAYIGNPVKTDDAVAAQWLSIIGEGRGVGQPRPMKLMSFWER